jgi:hypothetical protein
LPLWPPPNGPCRWWRWPRPPEDGTRQPRQSRWRTEINTIKFIYFVYLLKKYNHNDTLILNFFFTQFC